MERFSECKVPKFCEEFSKIPGSPNELTQEQQLALINLGSRIDPVKMRWMFFCAGANNDVCPIKPWMFGLITANNRTSL